MLIFHVVLNFCFTVENFATDIKQDLLKKNISLNSLPAQTEDILYLNNLLLSNGGCMLNFPVVNLTFPYNIRHTELHGTVLSWPDFWTFHEKMLSFSVFFLQRGHPSSTL